MASRREDLYETDFYAWTRVQARALRQLATTRSNTEIDWPHLIEEVADLGKSERDTVRSQLERIIEHTLKLEHSPGEDPCVGWAESIVEARPAIEWKLTATLRRDVRRRFARLYGKVRDRAARSLRLDGEADAAAALPPDCPYTLEQLLNPDWFPKSRHGLPDLV